MERVDQEILYALAGWRPFWLNRAMIDFTSLGSMTIIALITGITFLLLWIIASDHRAAFRILTASAGAELIVELLKRLVGRPRPAIVPYLVDITGFSFPSGHALVAAATYSTLAAIACGHVEQRNARRAIRCICWLVIVLVSVSRVYLGVHYPSDVVVGVLIGIVWGYCARRFHRTARSLN